MKEKWCCFGLEDAFSKREERGIFVFASPPDEGEFIPGFWLGMRSVNKKDQIEDEYKAEDILKIQKIYADAGYKFPLDVSLLKN